MVFVVFLLLLVSACNKETINEPTKPLDTDGPIDPMGKYETPVKVSIARSTDSARQFHEGDTWEDNDYTRAYKENFNIEIEHKVATNDDQYTERMNVVIASGDLPDIMLVNGSQLQQLVESDLIEDLTEYYDKYATPTLRETVEIRWGIGTSKRFI